MEKGDEAACKRCERRSEFPGCMENCYILNAYQEGIKDVPCVRETDPIDEYSCGTKL